MSIGLGSDNYVLISLHKGNSDGNKRGSKLGEKAEGINQFLSDSPDNLFKHIMSNDHDCSRHKAVENFKKKCLDLNAKCIDNITKFLPENKLLLQGCRQILKLKDDMADLAVLNYVVKALYTQDVSVYERLVRAISRGFKVNLVSLPLLNQQCKNAQDKISENPFVRLDDAIAYEDILSAKNMMAEMISTMQDEFEFLRCEPLSSENWENKWRNLYMQACICQSYWDENDEGIFGEDALAKVKGLINSLRDLEYKEPHILKDEKSPSYLESINPLKMAIKNEDKNLTSKFLTEFYYELRGNFFGDRPNFNALLQKAQFCLDLLTKDVRKALKDDVDFPFYVDSLEILKKMIETAIAENHLPN